MRRLAATCACCAVWQLVSPAPGQAQTMRTFSVSRASGNERSLRVTLDFSGGNVVLVTAPAGELYGLRLRYDADRYAPVQQYDPRTGLLHLGVEAIGGMGVRVTSRAQLEQTARVEFSPNVPLALSATIGSSDAAIDLGGTTLAELEVHSTTSHGTIDFSTPTRGDCRSAHFSVGAADLDVRRLAQAGCGDIRVDGGIGGVSLSFDGAWRRDADVVVDLAMGQLLLQIPRGTGVRIAAERFFAPFDAQGFEKSASGWETPGFAAAAHKLFVDIKASMTGIGVRWIAP